MDISSPAVSNYFSLINGALRSVGLNSTAASLTLSLLAFFIILSIIVSVASYLLGWFERKIIARAQSRHGPTYVGKFGILQNLADIIKLISKESIIPDLADKPVFLLVLPIFVASMILVITFVPFTQSFIGINTSLGLFAVFVIISFSPLLLFLAGWTSGNKFSSISAQRSVVMMVSYEIPMFVVIASVAMLSGGFGFINIVSSQAALWNAVRMPIGFIIFFIVILAELERPPFDLREADSELIAGWLTDVNAPYFSLALLLDYTRMFLGSLLIVVLFLGGWLGPTLIPALMWLMIKVLIVSFFIILIRATMVRMRVDKAMKLGWLYLTPLAIVNLLLTFIIFVR